MCSKGSRSDAGPSVAAKPALDIHLRSETERVQAPATWFLEAASAPANEVWKACDFGRDPNLGPQAVPIEVIFWIFRSYPTGIQRRRGP